MLFEIRTTKPAVSAEWEAVRDLFEQGKTREAWATSCSESVDSKVCLTPETAEDWLLCIEVARGMGRHRRSMVLTRRALMLFPNHRLLQLFHARNEMMRGRFWSAIQDLESQWNDVQSMHDDRTEQLPGLWSAMLADLYGTAGFVDSCRQWLEISNERSPDPCAVTLYTRAAAYHGMRAWSEATEILRQCISKADRWTRAVTFLGDCLLAEGRVEETLKLMQKTQVGECQDFGFDMLTASLSLSLGQFDQAAHLLADMLKHWPNSDAETWIRRTLCILLIESGDWETATQIAGDERENFLLPELDRAVSGRHAFLPLPLISQHRNECVPTSVLMCLHDQQESRTAKQIYGEMGGQSGVALHRMRDWCWENAYEVTAVKPSLDAVMTLTQAGIPLLGTLEGLFSSHVEVVCGGHEGLELIYVRDPMNWLPVAYPSEMALERYALQGCLIAITPRANSEAGQLAESFLSAEGTALLDLSEAAAKGEISVAEEAFRRIPDNSPTAFLRDLYARHVVLSQAELLQRLESYSTNKDVHAVARFRAILSLGITSENPAAQELIENRDERLGVTGLRYLKLLQAVFYGHWEEALQLCQQLLVTSSAMPELWVLHSDVLIEMGRSKEAEACLQRAIELEPERTQLRRKLLERKVNHLTWKEFIAEFNELPEAEMRDPTAIWTRVMVLQDGPNGRQFHDAIRNYLQLYPRDVVPYLVLQNWFQAQGRDDLANEIIEVARRWLPAEFPETNLPPDEKPDKATAQQEDSKPISTEFNKPTTSGSTPKSTQHDDIPQLLNQFLDTPEHDKRTSILESLVSRRDQTTLTWQHHASIVCCQILHAQELNDKEGILRALATQRTGPDVWYAEFLTERMTEFTLSISTAELLAEWVPKSFREFRKTPNLWFNRILLLENAKQPEEAVRELEELIERYPGYSSALYRLGCVKYGQQDFTAAESYFRKALDVNPGLPGAMTELQALLSELEDSPATLEVIRRLRNKFPFSTNILRDELNHVAISSPEQALQLIETHQGEFHPLHVQLLRARLDLKTEQLTSAEQRLKLDESVEELPEDIFEEWLHLGLVLAEIKRDLKSTLEMCEVGLSRWPDSTRLLELQASALRQKNPAAAEASLKTALVEGNFSGEILYMWLSLQRHTPDKAIQKLFEKLPQDRQLELLELGAEVLSASEFLNRLQPYLEWVTEIHPESNLVAWRLVQHYTITDQVSKAVKLSEKLVERNPDSPEAKRTLGRCLIDKDPQRALKILKDVCKRNRSADYLFDLARCHLIVGDEQNSRKIHLEILENNPFLAASWTNLTLMGEPDTKLWPFVTPMLKRGAGTQDEYFIVAVVDMAKRMNECLPQDWFNLAAERWEILKTHAGFADEQIKLRDALSEWVSMRPQDQYLTVIDVPKRDLLERFIAWLRREKHPAWIPETAT